MLLGADALPLLPGPLAVAAAAVRRAAADAAAAVRHERVLRWKALGTQRDFRPAPVLSIGALANLGVDQRARSH
jgi:hypothetical protein